MAVYKRGTKTDPRWVCDFVVSGSRVNHTLHGARTKADAQAAEAVLKAEYKARLGRSGTVVRMTVETAIQRYLTERLKPKAKVSTLERYLSCLGLLREYFGPATPIENITKARVREWWSHELGRGLALNSARRYLAQLKALLAFAREAGAGCEVPDFSPTIPDDARIRWLTQEEEVRLLAAAPSALRDLLTFYLDSGARKSEATGLRWRDVDLDRNPVLARLYETKGGQPRGVPLPPRSAALLKRLRAERPKDKPDDAVFLLPLRGTGPMAPAGDFKKGWDSARRKAGLEDVHIHDLLHTYASRLVQGGSVALSTPPSAASISAWTARRDDPDALTRRCSVVGMASTAARWSASSVAVMASTAA